LSPHDLEQHVQSSRFTSPQLEPPAESKVPVSKGNSHRSPTTTPEREGDEDRSKQPDVNNELAALSIAMITRHHNYLRKFVLFTVVMPVK
jgi:hypothetical protein